MSDAANKVLIVGLGNPDRGDDGIGAQGGRYLQGRLAPDTTVRACRGDVLTLIDDWAGFDALICVDAAAPVEAAGRVHRIDLATDTLPREMSFASSHALGLAEAIDLARTLRLAPRDIVIYAVEGACFDTGAGLTPEVAAAAGPVADRIVEEAERLRLGVQEDTTHA